MSLLSALRPRAAQLLLSIQAAQHLAPLLGACAARALQHQAVRWSSSSDRQQEQERKALLNKMLYRSRQRGWLELDLLMGLWAERELPKLSAPELVEYQAVLEQENPDLFKWISGQKQPPADLEANHVFKLIRADVKKMLLEHSPQATRAPEGKAWVRGWDDHNKGEAPQGGASAPAPPS